MTGLQISKFLQYCEGFSYLDKKGYDSALAQERNQERVMQYRMDNLQRQQQYQQLNPANLQQTQPMPQQPANLIQRAFNLLIATPFQNMMQFIAQPFQTVPRALGQMLQLPRQAMEATVSRILSFFFSHKKDKTEEKEVREKNDFAQSDLFTKRTVEASQNNAGQNSSK